MKSFKQFLTEGIHHHIKHVCECGNIMQCRCRAEKTIINVKECPSCNGNLTYRDLPNEI